MENKSQEAQKQIVRQSQVKAVLEYFTLIGKKPSLTDVIKTTTMMEQYIYNGYSQKLKEQFESLDKHLEEIK